jgi:hypothetical protein
MNARKRIRAVNAEPPSAQLKHDVEVICSGFSKSTTVTVDISKSASIVLCHQLSTPPGRVVFVATVKHRSTPSLYPL